MRKLGYTLAILMALAPFVVLAETDYVAQEYIDAIRKGKNVDKQIEDLRVKDDAIIGDDATVGGKLDVDEEITSYGYTAVVTGTNNQDQVFRIITGTFVATGDAADITNTFSSPVFIAAPVFYNYTMPGYAATNVISGVASNRFIIADPPTSGVYMAVGRIT